jgi:hypothetical protein
MAGGARKILVGCLVAAGALALILVLLVAAFGFWGAYANARAERAATALCSGIRVGERIESVTARAKASDPPARSIGNTSDGEYRYAWYGQIFSSRECLVATANGRVTAKHVVKFDD